jgi:hypothetical protein
MIGTILQGPPLLRYTGARGKQSRRSALIRLAVRPYDLRTSMHPTRFSESLSAAHKRDISEHTTKKSDVFQAAKPTGRSTGSWAGALERQLSE